MVILISGASHTGKTHLAQKLLEKYNYPYLSIDHIKMGLIRSGNTNLTPLSKDKDLINYLWPIVREIIKTSIENNQNLIVEGCYIPFNWQKDFDETYLKNIKHTYLIMSENYIKNNYATIKEYSNIIENRKDDSDISLNGLIKDNSHILKGVQKYKLNHIIINDKYDFNSFLNRL